MSINKYFSGLITKSEIKQKYRNLIKQYHPDVYGGCDSEEITKEIIEEYNRLIELKDEDLEYEMFSVIEKERVTNVKFLATEFLENTIVDIKLIIQQLKDDKELVYSGCSINKLIRELRDISFMLADRHFQDYKEALKKQVKEK
jgi:hypothetical protein